MSAIRFETICLGLGLVLKILKCWPCKAGRSRTYAGAGLKFLFQRLRKLCNAFWPFWFHSISQFQQFLFLAFWLSSILMYSHCCQDGPHSVCVDESPGELQVRDQSTKTNHIMLWHFNYAQCVYIYIYLHIFYVCVTAVYTHEFAKRTDLNLLLYIWARYFALENERMLALAAPGNSENAKFKPPGPEIRRNGLRNGGLCALPRCKAARASCQIWLATIVGISVQRSHLAIKYRSLLSIELFRSLLLILAST